MTPFARHVLTAPRYRLKQTDELFEISEPVVQFRAPASYGIARGW